METVDKKDETEVQKTQQPTSRKRGRPAIYTPEERIARKKERARLRREKKKALKATQSKSSKSSDTAPTTETSDSEVYSEVPNNEVPEPVTAD